MTVDPRVELTVVTTAHSPAHLMDAPTADWMVDPRVELMAHLTVDPRVELMAVTMAETMAVTMAR